MFHGGKSDESRNEPSPLLASNWQQQAQQQHRSSQCALPLGHEHGNSAPPQASFQQQAYQDEDGGHTYCRNGENASQWKENEDRHWNQPAHPFSSPSDNILRTLPSPTTSPGGDRLGPNITTSDIQDGGGFTSTSVRGISNFENMTSMTAAALLPPHQSTAHHNQLKLPLQLEGDAVQPLPLPNMDVGTIWSADSPQLTSTQRSQHPYPVHRPLPILRHSLHEPQYHNQRVPPGFEDIGVGPMSRLSGTPPPSLVHNSVAITTADVTTGSVVDLSPDLSSRALHHSRYGAVHELGGHHPVFGSEPGSQSHHHHLEVPTSDINNEGSKLLRMLHVPKEGRGVNTIEGESVGAASGMHASSAEHSDENVLSQGDDQGNNTMESSIAETVVKKSSSHHGIPQQSSYSSNDEAVVDDLSCSSQMVHHSSLQGDSSKIAKKIDGRQEEKKDKKPFAPLRSPSIQVI